jgi:hypothetical protein
MNDHLMTVEQLAAHWQCSVKKLNADRLSGSGCSYVKIGRLVRYRAEDVAAYETRKLRRNTSEGRDDA